jgi:hypothetical protein
VNVADTCSVWNVISSELFYRTSLQAECSFCSTTFVEYECLHKPRKRPSPEDTELQRRLKKAKTEGSFKCYPLEIADLQDVAVLENRKKVSKGELASIVFASKVGQAFLTDDRGAQRLAARVMVGGMVQTTPHLFAWLFFTGRLSDGDKDIIISAHEELNRPLRPHFEEAYLEALRCRLMFS